MGKPMTPQLLGSLNTGSMLDPSPKSLQPYVWNSTLSLPDATKPPEQLHGLPPAQPCPTGVWRNYNSQHILLGAQQLVSHMSETPALVTIYRGTPSNFCPPTPLLGLGWSYPLMITYTLITGGGPLTTWY